LKRHVVLIGLPGVGKSTVGRLVAQELGCSLVDVDRRIVLKQGMSVSRIFDRYGAPKFRELERQVVAEALVGPACVIAPGAGWAAQEGEMEKAKDTSLIVYLVASPELAAERASRGQNRPLLKGHEPILRMHELLSERERYYQMAHYQVASEDDSPGSTAREIVALARSHAGW
jgi:shikimate kinase